MLLQLVEADKVKVYDVDNDGACCSRESLCPDSCGTTFAAEHGPAVTHLVVKEGNDAVLPCSLSTTSIKQELFDWKKDGQREVFMYDRGSIYDEKRSGQDEHFKGRVFHFPERLESGNASIVIRDTKVADSGNYTCDFPFHQPIRRSHIVLVVESQIRGSPEPSVMIVEQTNDGLCEMCRPWCFT
ncbi:hypothetical protein INR49_002413 [Caranx melampygus]|nr:hypothetical protein INR49_002413 [Caranx melampygus]